MDKRTSTADLLRCELFADEMTNVSAILDGASVPDLLRKLDEHGREHVCLFTGQDDSELAETAPYLVHLDAQSPFTDWVLDEGWGKHWGIFAAVPDEISFRDVRNHLRSFLRVRDPDGKPLLFRYYDPRVFRVYLPTCNAAELGAIFGPVAMFMLEGEDAGTFLGFMVSDGAVKEHKVVLAG